MEYFLYKLEVVDSQSLQAPVGIWLLVSPYWMEAC